MQVNYLENDNVLLENKQKELKGTLNNLLQSRESFVHAYEVILLFVIGAFVAFYTHTYIYKLELFNAGEWCYISLQYLIYKEKVKWEKYIKCLQDMKNIQYFFYVTNRRISKKLLQKKLELFNANF